MSRIGLSLILSATLLVTACSAPPVQSVKFADRQQFNAYVDSLDVPDAWKESIKQECSRASGKYLNNMVTYLRLDPKGDPVMQLVRKYGMKAEISLDGVDPGPAVKAAVNELIQKGDEKNIYKNGRWLDNEELGGGSWGEGANAFQQAAEFAKQRGDQKRGPESQPDFDAVRNR